MGVEVEKEKDTREKEKEIKDETNKDNEETKNDDNNSTTKTEDIDTAQPSEYCTKLCKKQRENDKYKPVLVHGNDFREAIQKWSKNHNDSPYGPILGCWDTSQVTDMSSAFMDSDEDDSAMNLNCWETKEVKYMQGMFFNSKFNRPLDSWNNTTDDVKNNDAPENADVEIVRGKEEEKKDAVEVEKEKDTREKEKEIKDETNKDNEETKNDDNNSTTKTEDIDTAQPSEYCTKLCKKQRENDKYKPVLVHGNDFREAIQKWGKNHDDSPYGPILGCWDTSQVTDMSSAF